MAVIETVRGVTTRVLFLPVILTRFQEWNSLLPESPKACQHYYAAFVKALLNGMVSARARALPENSVTPNGLVSLTDITDAGYNRSPVTHTRNFPVGRNLGPGQRRGARPCRWPHSGCWGRLRRGCWRGGRRRSGSGRGRRRTSFNCSKDIDPTPTIHVIWRTRTAALSRSNVDSRVIHCIAPRGKLMSQTRNSRPQ